MKGPLVKKLFETYATGQYTVQDLRQISSSWGLVSRSEKPVVKAELFRILTRSFYYGLMKYKGDILQGTHEPLVTKELFDKVQEVLIRRGKPHKYKKKYFPLLGLALCATCGGAITAEKQKGHQEREMVNQLVARLKETMAQEIPQIQNKLDRLLDAHLAGLISQAEYIAKKETLLNQKIALEAKLSQMQKGATGWLEPAKNFIRAAHSAGELANGENLEAKKEFLKKIGSNFRVGGRRLSFEFKNPWWLFSDFSCFSHSSAGETAIPAGSFFAPVATSAAGFFQNPIQLENWRKG